MRTQISREDRLISDTSAHLFALRRNWVALIVLTMVGVLGGALATTLTAPVYQAQSDVFLATSSGDSFNEQSQGQAVVESRIRSYAAITSSPLVLDPVIDSLDLDITADELASRVTASVQLDTVLLTITATDASAEGAAELTNAVVASLADVLADIGDGSDDPGRPSVSLVTTREATAPTGPARPRILFNLALGGLIGLAVGGLGVVLRGRYGLAPISNEAVAATTGAPRLGELPRVKPAPSHPMDPGEPFSEAIRQVRTRILSHSTTQSAKTILVTSARSGEGTTTVASELALAIARSGISVCLVDGNLRRPAVSKYFGVQRSPGLSEVLEDDSLLKTAMALVPNTGLAVLTSGSDVDYPGELLSRPAVPSILTALQREYQMVVIDAPAVGEVSETVILASMVHHTVLVTAAWPTAKDLERATAALRGVEAILLGTVANGVRDLPSPSPGHRTRS